MNDKIPDVIPPSDVASDWLAQEAARASLHARLIPVNKRALFEAMIAGSVTRVEVSFDGYGDSGQVENVTAQAGDAVVDLPQREVILARALSGKAEPERQTSSLADAIEQLVYDLLEETHGGWENDVGAFGDVIFDAATQSITLDYNERFESSEYSQHVF